MKKCPKCHIEKPVEDFHRQKSAKDGRGSWCKPCQTAYMRKYRAEHPDAFVEYRFRNRLKFYYGISPEEYDEMLKAQGGVCAICKKPPSKRALHLDHCHDTGTVRGILCHQCNIGIGMFQDSPELLASATEYLRDKCGKV